MTIIRRLILTLAIALLALLLVVPVQAEILRPGGGRGAPLPAGPSGDHRPSVPHRWEWRGHGDRSTGTG